MRYHRCSILFLKENYPKLYEAAYLEYCRQCLSLDGKPNRRVFDSYSLGTCFTWSDTVEGHRFWKEVRGFNFKVAKELIPQYF